MTDVRQAMHEGADWCPPTASVRELSKLMREKDIGAIPIGENDRLIGMVTDRDIACRAFEDGKDISSLTARDVMSEGILYCKDDQSLEAAIKMMDEKKIRRLPVIDSNKRMVGMLTLGDLSQAAPRELAGELASAVSAHH